MTLSGLLSGEIVHDCVENLLEREMGSLKSAIARPKKRAWTISHLACMTIVFFSLFQNPTLLSEFLFNLLFVTEKQKSIKNLIKNVEIFLDSLAYDFSTRSFG